MLNLKIYLSWFINVFQVESDNKFDDVEKKKGPGIFFSFRLGLFNFIFFYFALSSLVNGRGKRVWTGMSSDAVGKF